MTDRETPAGAVETPHGTRFVLVTEDADTLFFGRADDGRLLTFVWGEPDEHGWYTPTITATDDGHQFVPRVDVERWQRIETAARDVDSLWSGEDGELIQCEVEAGEALEDLRSALRDALVEG